MKKLFWKINLVALVFSVCCGFYSGKKPMPEANPVEYQLANGLHVILCPDSTSPIVNVGVMYHVGSKNERSDRTGFAHLFEHLLFNGTKNIPEGEMDGYIRSAGGYSNASTSADRTYYYNILPSNQLRLGLWIESERMMHPIISRKVIDREKEVVKEESRQRYDSNPLGRIPEKVQAADYPDFPYHWPVVGSMEHLDAASEEDFTGFFNKFYVPGNAALVVTGDVEPTEARQYIEAYFGRVPEGEPVIQPEYGKSAGSAEVKIDSVYNLPEPHMVISYKTVAETHPDAIVLSMINSHLTLVSDNALGALNKTIPGSIRIASSAELYEKAGTFWFRSSFRDSVNYRLMVAKIDSVIEDLKNKGLAPSRISMLKFSYQKDYTDMFYDMQFLAEMLAYNHLMWGSARRVNQLIPMYLSVRNDDIIRVARTYFTPENRNILLFYPAKTLKKN